MGTTNQIIKSIAFILILATPACMTVPKGVGDYDAGYVEQGIASWYGGDFHGRLTASGAVYDQFKLTAAHRLLPLGSVVRITNADNGRVVEVVSTTAARTSKAASSTFPMPRPNSSAALIPERSRSWSK